MLLIAVHAEKWSIRKKGNSRAGKAARVRASDHARNYHGDDISRERAKSLLRSLRRSIVLTASIQSAVRIIACPTITRYAIRRRPIMRVSPLIGISQDRKLARVQRKTKEEKKKDEDSGTGEGVGPSTV